MLKAAAFLKEFKVLKGYWNMGSYHSKYLHMAYRKKEKGGRGQYKFTSLPGYKRFPFQSKSYAVTISYNKIFKLEWCSLPSTS